MARIARVVVPGVPHHVTQRGNRHLRTFFRNGDYSAYLELMAEWCGRCGVEIWAYCLMPNHVHLIAVPEEEDGLRRGIGEAHRRYTRRVNDRRGWRGHLWQGRFASFPMDEAHLWAAVRYVELNPVRAGLVRKAEDYPWSSAAAHVQGEDDGLVKAGTLLEWVEDWKALLADGVSDEELEAVRCHERTGRPLGSETFVARLEKTLGRVLRPLTRGRKRGKKLRRKKKPRSSKRKRN
ncbi:MAG: transposase [Planctomycetes bacterium]|nr:transposase [Planctomycetota bacterium]